MERLILEGVATFQEIETHYSLLDVLERNLALDAFQKAKAARAQG
jgi:hypothetical protein